ncbi:MAG: universal stress protein [Winogradskyella sp.]|nr:universal stress protein [Winogradskyella sp.]
MKNILVPVGSSKNAKSHLQYAVDFASEFGAKVYVVQIYNVYTKAGTMIKVDHILERESRSFLEEHVASVDTKGVQIVTKTYKGKLVDTLELICESLSIDAIVLEPRTNSIKDEVFLGNTSGKIVKQTNIPVLIVPEGCTYKPIHSILLAMKSAIVKREDALKPLIAIKNQYNSSLHLLLVETPYHNKGDFDVPKVLGQHVDKTTTTTNPTTYLGVLEYYKEINPDLICVVRRNRGFFTKLWEKNTILKKDFYIPNTPVLVLRGLKN